MTRSRPRTHALASITLATALALTAAACGDDDDGGEATATTATGGSATSSAAGAGGAAATDLAGVCPETIGIQTDWNPEAEHGALFQLFGDEVDIDGEQKSASAPLVAAGDVDTGVRIEVRTGGPAIGFQTVVSQLYQDPALLLGYVSTDESLQNSGEFPTKAIVAPLDINPQIIMWDPVTYPDVRTIADLKATGARVRYFETGAYMQYLLNSGQLDPAQVDGSYDGSPANFVADGGASAQQGFASAEPYIYENEVGEWGKPVAFELVHDAGWQPYAAALAVRADEFEANRACFEKLVPIVQQAQVDFVTDPAETNELILRLVEEYNTGWVYSAGVADFSVRQQLELGLVGNGTDETLGNFDLDRVTTFLDNAYPVYEANGDDPAPGLTPEDLVTNEFIDPSIGLTT